ARRARRRRAPNVPRSPPGQKRPRTLAPRSRRADAQTRGRCRTPRPNSPNPDDTTATANSSRHGRLAMTHAAWALWTLALTLAFGRIAAYNLGNYRPVSNDEVELM